jgi:hypothetical protein
MAALLAYCVTAVLCVAVLWLAARFYLNAVRNLWAFSKWIVGRLQFYFSWFSFLRRREKIERFKALADRLWWRDQVRQAADRNILPPR